MRINDARAAELLAWANKDRLYRQHVIDLLTDRATANQRITELESQLAKTQVMNTIVVEIGVKLDVAELVKLSPDRIAAVAKGLSEVLVAVKKQSAGAAEEKP